MVRTGQKRKKRLEPIAIRLDPDVKAAMQRLAEADDRSLAWMINRALKEWLEERRQTSRSAAPGFREPDP
jgi:predicted transcriptional regulator